MEMWLWSWRCWGGCWGRRSAVIDGRGVKGAAIASFYIHKKPRFRSEKSAADAKELLEKAVNFDKMIDINNLILYNNRTG